MPTILQPIAVLIAWSLVMWVWLYATRLPAMARAKIDGKAMVGSTGRSLRDDLVAAGEVRASWKADNYNHLMEQPTLFYAVALLLAVSGFEHEINTVLAWAYVVMRILHSIVQVTSNRVVIRFVLHVLGTLPLIGLTVHALAVVF